MYSSPGYFSKYKKVINKINIFFKSTLKPTAYLKVQTCGQQLNDNMATKPIPKTQWQSNYKH